MGPSSRSRSPKQPPPKQTFFLVKRDEDGAWYYSTAIAVHDQNVTRLMVGFVPNDLAADRRFYKEKFWETDRVKADLYLNYTVSIFGVELLCASGQFRFLEGSLDLAGTRAIGVQNVPKDWQEWSDTAGTPWDDVRARVCR